MSSPGLVWCTIAIFGVLGLSAALPGQTADDLTVHEWGTFTTLTVGQGEMMVWNPLGGPSDLPAFVHDGSKKLKADIDATVRMETPVLYFYTSRPRTLDVRVDFPDGLVTEWYPHGHWSPFEGNSIHWPKVELHPEGGVKIPDPDRRGHYFAARDAQATPLTVTLGNPATTEAEGFLFYRGIGNPKLPIEVRFDQRSIRVKSLDPAPMPYIVFENRGGQCDYGIYGAWREKNDMSVPRPGPESIRYEGVDHAGALERLLLMHGLKDAEAKAMIKTWKDDWFEPGLRVFWIVPDAVVDRILPLTIKPAPVAVKRVFVGRVEILTEEFISTVQRSIDQALHGNPKPLLAHGRFARPFALERLRSFPRDSAPYQSLSSILWPPSSPAGPK